jgi:hypothetical protein
MICPECHGSGRRRLGGLPNAPAATGEAMPCLECGGCGIVHCCEGERPDCIVEPNEEPRE